MMRILKYKKLKPNLQNQQMKIKLIILQGIQIQNFLEIQEKKQNKILNIAIHKM